MSRARLENQNKSNCKAKMLVKFALVNGDIEKCFPVISQLLPNLISSDELIKRVKLFDYAASRQCDAILLSSKVQNKIAHRFYFQHGMDINAFWFRKNC